MKIGKPNPSDASVLDRRAPRTITAPADATANSESENDHQAIEMAELGEVLRMSARRLRKPRMAAAAVAIQPRVPVMICAVLTCMGTPPNEKLSHAGLSGSTAQRNC